MGLRGFQKTPPASLHAIRKVLTREQKVVAHKIVMGATIGMAAQDVGVSAHIVEKWTWSRNFVEYTAKLEKRFYLHLEKQILKLRQSAFKVLEHSLSSDDAAERRWAVEKVLHATEDKTMHFDISSARVDDRPGLSDEGKAAAKAYYAELAQQRDAFFKEVN